jgi:hypothetical protein
VGWLDCPPALTDCKHTDVVITVLKRASTLSHHVYQAWLNYHLVRVVLSVVLRFPVPSDVNPSEKSVRIDGGVQRWRGCSGP